MQIFPVTSCRRVSHGVMLFGTLKMKDRSQVLAQNQDNISSVPTASPGTTLRIDRTRHILVNDIFVVYPALQRHLTTGHHHGERACCAASVRNLPLIAGHSLPGSSSATSCKVMHRTYFYGGCGSPTSFTSHGSFWR